MVGTTTQSLIINNIIVINDATNANFVIAIAGNFFKYMVIFWLNRYYVHSIDARKATIKY